MNRLAEIIHRIKVSAQSHDTYGRYEVADVLTTCMMKLAQSSWDQMQNRPGLGNITPGKLENSALGFSLGMTHWLGQATNQGGAAHGTEDFRNIMPGENPEEYDKEKQEFDRNYYQNSGIGESSRQQYNQLYSQYPYIQDKTGNWIPNPSYQMSQTYSNNPSVSDGVPNGYGTGINSITQPTNVPDVAPPLPIQPYKPFG